MSYKVLVAPEAKLLFAELNEWWIEHRSSARSRVVDEYSRLILELADTPNSGVLIEERNDHQVRRLRLRGTSYYLYYFVAEKPHEVLVVSLWSAMRGEGPPI